MSSRRPPLNVAVFASGGGTNFQALLDHQETQDLWRIVLLVMNREAGAARRAGAAGVPVRIVPTRDRDEDEIAQQLLGLLDRYAVDVILLAGYLRRVPTAVVERYRGRMLNIHPALLPDFGGPGMYGAKVHEAVLASEAESSGATVHFVSEEYDEGAILGQWRVDVHAEDTPQTLAERVLSVEHRLYPAAVDHLCSALLDGRAPERLDDEPPSAQTTNREEEDQA